MLSWDPGTHCSSLKQPSGRLAHPPYLSLAVGSQAIDFASLRLGFPTSKVELRVGTISAFLRDLLKCTECQLACTEAPPGPQHCAATPPASQPGARRFQTPVGHSVDTSVRMEISTMELHRACSQRPRAITATQGSLSS